MNEGWMQQALGPQHVPLVVLALDIDTVLMGEGPTELRVCMNPVLREVGEELFERIMAVMEEGILSLRHTPLDDLNLGEWCDS